MHCWGTHRDNRDAVSRLRSPAAPGAIASRSWRWVLVGAMLLALCGPQAAPAQAPFQPGADPGAPGLRQAVSNGWIRLEMNAGRIQIAGLPVGNVSTSSTRPGLQERLTVRNTGSGPAVNYERTTSASKLTIDAEGERLRISHTPVGSADLAAVEFTQQSDEPLTLTVGSETEQQVFCARSLWHLLVVYSGPSRKHLLPLIGLLRPDWNLAALLDAIEDELRRQAAGRPPDVAALDRLVAQLADQQFSRREAAERRLRASGPAVLGYLEGLDLAGLDAEQRFRLGRTMASLRASLGESRPQEIAAWLSGDLEVWLALLERPDTATRRLAARQIETRLGGSIGVDPEREPVEQQAERTRLRERLERAGLLPPVPDPSPQTDSPAAPSPPGAAPQPAKQQDTIDEL